MDLEVFISFLRAGKASSPMRFTLVMSDLSGDFQNAVYISPGFAYDILFALFIHSIFLRINERKNNGLKRDETPLLCIPCNRIKAIYIYKENVVFV